MPELWFPGARVVNRNSASYTLLGGPRVAVWHTTETDEGTALAVANGANMAKWPAHLIWDPYTGEIVQLLAANRAGGALVTGNREGSAVLQIEAVGHAASGPLHSSPLLGLDHILEWLDSWGIPRVWPAGSPLPYPQSYGAGNGQRHSWGKSGHYAHSQVPGNDHGDPGTVDLSKWSQAATSPVVNTAYSEPPLGYLLVRGARDLVQGRYTFVRWLQARLAAHGAVLLIDGDFGANTETAVRAFQKSRGLTVDGVMGAKTHTLLK